MKHIAWRTVLPALLAITLFSGVVFIYLLPSLDRVVRDQKRLMIRELTESAWNVMARFEAEEQAGRLTRDAAQDAAVAQIRNLHYGQQQKDYFWVIDMVPNMVVHPYRPDLEGTDLTTFGDPEGKFLFVEMVRTVEREGSGYVEYMWQWKDNAERIVPKLSYVKGFDPWGWIIGTGVYTQDVDAEIDALTGTLQTASLLILAVVSLLLFLLLRAGFQAERGRLRVSAALQVSEEKYRLLVESAGESIVMAISGEGLYANTSLLHLLGYERDEFARMDIAKVILPTEEETRRKRRNWQMVQDGVEAPSRYEAELLHKSGQTLKVMLTLSRIVVQGRIGFMAVATRMSRPRELDILTASNLDDLEAASRRTRDLAALMMNHGAHAVQVSRILSSSADDVVRKAVEFIVEEMGPPPLPFDIMLMGSLGRSEVTLHADQDHAIIYPDVPEAEAETVQAYFLGIGSRLADLLAAAGYPYCEGKIMASEPACCQSLSAWCATFDRWITSMEAEDLLHAKIFFDFRSALGEGTLVPALQAHLQKTLTAQPRFYPLLAHNILLFEPPINTFGNLVLQDVDDARSAFDIKGVLAQVVDITRLRALQHGVSPASTLERLDALAASDHLNQQTMSDTADAFMTLLDLRLKHQARRRTNKLDVDNMVDPETLNDVEMKALKQSFNHLKAMQESMRHEFGARQ
jgi:CBS domain-containing protein